MRFWDASAIVPLCVREPGTEHVRAILEGDSTTLGFVWILSPTEIYSALCRKHREGALTEAGLEAARAKRDAWLDRSIVVRDVLAVARRADRLLRVHSLRAADSLQLAAAILTCEPDIHEHPFVTFDGRLADAARREGFPTPLRDVEVR